MIKGRSKSILLQVAFKEAAKGNDATTINEVLELTRLYYSGLLSLHEELGIDPSDGEFTRGGGGGGARKASTFVKPQGETFIYNTVMVEDFRAAKAAPGSTLKPNYPDFKTVDESEIAGVTNAKGAAWLRGQDGAINDALSDLVAAADTRVM